jgi:hypothetical protein
VENSAALLREVLAEKWDGSTVVIYHLFDNNCFYAVDPNGNRSLPTRSMDGKYHVIGDLAFADRGTLKELFTAAVPLLRAGGMQKKIIISPLMRYILAPCCTKPNHMANRKDGEFGPELTSALENLFKWIKEMAYMKRIKNYYVLCPNATLADGVTSKKEAKMVAKYWKADPVHMSKDGYKRLALGIIEDLVDIEFERPVDEDEDKQQPSRSTPLGGQPRGRGTGRERGLVDRADSRRDWVSKNDAVVHRNYGHEEGRHPRGAGGRRGNFGGRGGSWKSNRGYRGSYSRGRGRSHKFRPY